MAPLNHSSRARLVKTLSAVSIVCLLALSGCAGKTKSTVHDQPGVTPAQYTDETGGVEGVVVTDEIVPIAGAMVGIPSLGLSSQTDAAGRYSLSNVQPGEHQIHATMLGYGSLATTITVVAGEVTFVDNLILMRTALPDAAHRYTDTQKGRLQCGTSVIVKGVVSGGLSACSVLSEVDPTIDRFQIDWEIPGPTSAITALVIEMEWISTQALGRSLNLVVEDAGCVNADDEEGTLVYMEKVSPIRAYFTGEQMMTKISGSDGADKECAFAEVEMADKECLSDDSSCPLVSRVFASSGTAGEAAPADAGATLQQEFTIYLTAFYGPLPPDVENYTHLAT